MLRQNPHTKRLVQECLENIGFEPWRKKTAVQFRYTGDAGQQNVEMAVVDFSLYLITDSTSAILGDRDLVSVVEKALEGGVTVVQYRDKTSDTVDLIRTGLRLHEVCKRFKIPLLINDRVDVALAIGCEGVHLGLEAMNYTKARRILGPTAIIGITVNNVAEAVLADVQINIDKGPAYLAIETVFPTVTEENTKSIIGPEGVRAILDGISSLYLCPTSSVAIGGIDASNVQRVIFQSQAPNNQLDGVAVVSSIMAAKDPRAAASNLKRLITTVPLTMSPSARSNVTVANLIGNIPEVVKKVGSKSPLCHNMTNLVVQNFAANVTLAIGASPTMSNYGEEAGDLTSHGGSLVINMGTMTPGGLVDFEKAVKAYNEANLPILLDPVGAGATAMRRNATKRLLRNGYFTVIKGNEKEIIAVFGDNQISQRDVDRSNGTTSCVQKARLVRDLAARERNVILMTGKVDFLSDGARTLTIRNGHECLGAITGTGCTLGATIAACLAVHADDRLLATLAGVLIYEIAAERAAERGEVRGPGTFVPALLDELYLIQEGAKNDYVGWLGAARVDMFDDSLLD